MKKQPEKLITRATANRLKLTTYTAGEPCKTKYHGRERYTRTAGCVRCQEVRNAKRKTPAKDDPHYQANRKRNWAQVVRKLEKEWKEARTRRFLEGGGEQ